MWALRGIYDRHRYARMGSLSGMMKQREFCSPSSPMLLRFALRVGGARAIDAPMVASARVVSGIQMKIKHWRPRCEAICRISRSQPFGLMAIGRRPKRAT